MSESTAPPFDHRTHEEGVEGDDVNTTPIVVVGLISTALVLASALGVQALYESYASMLRQERVYDQPYDQAKAALNQQMAKLSRYRAPSGDRTAYSIPIQRAMTLVVEEQRAQQSEEGASQTEEGTSQSESSPPDSASSPPE